MSLGYHTQQELHRARECADRQLQEQRNVPQAPLAVLMLGAVVVLVLAVAVVVLA